jgi:hypothetical protein
MKFVQFVVVMRSLQDRSRLSASSPGSCHGAVRAKRTNLMVRGFSSVEGVSGAFSRLRLGASQRRAKCQIGLPFQKFMPPACRVSATLGGLKRPHL